MSTIRQFISESPDNRAIYVGLTQNTGEKLLSLIPSTEDRLKVMAIGVDSTGRSYQKLSTDAEYILAPHVALQASAGCKRVLIVFDDVFMHSLKEKHVYDLASQPAPPKLILNELMEATGVFTGGQEVTTMVIADTDSSTLQLQKDEDDLVAHIESIADHVISFDCEQSKKRLGMRNLPIL